MILLYNQPICKHIAKASHANAQSKAFAKSLQNQPNERTGL